MALVVEVHQRMDVHTVEHCHRIDALCKTQGEPGDRPEPVLVCPVGDAEIGCDGQSRFAPEILAVPTTTAGLLAPSATASQFTRGLTRSRVERGLNSTPAWNLELKR